MEGGRNIAVTVGRLKLYDDDTLAPSADACEESSHPLPNASDSTAASGLSQLCQKWQALMPCGALHRLMTTRSWANGWVSARSTEKENLAKWWAAVVWLSK